MDKNGFQYKFLDDLKKIIKTESKHQSKVLLLSGGIDSFLLLVLLIDLFDIKNITTYTISCKETYDKFWSIKTTEYFDVKHYIYILSPEKIYNNIHLAYNTNLTKTFYFYDYILLKLLFSHFNIKNSDIFWGEGADRLYGSTNKFIYFNTRKLSQINKWDIISTKNYLKTQFFQKPQSKDISIICELMRENGNNVISPYRHKEISWVNKIPFDIISPQNKRFVKDALVKYYYLPKNFVNRKRTWMELGTGGYKEFENYLKTKYGYISKNLNSITKYLCSNYKYQSLF